MEGSPVSVVSVATGALEGAIGAKSEPKKDFLGCFWALPSTCKEERIKACRIIVEHLVKGQEKLQSEVKVKGASGDSKRGRAGSKGAKRVTRDDSEDESGEEVDETDEDDGEDDSTARGQSSEYFASDNICVDLGYALRRLVRGLSSSRDSARQGFATTLSELLRRFEVVSLSEVWKFAKEVTETTNGMKGLEERELLFGRLFASLAIVRSERLEKEAQVTVKKDLPLCVDMVLTLLALYKKKKYLQEAAVEIVGQVLPLVSADQFRLRLVPALSALLEGPVAKYNAEQMMLALLLCRYLSQWPQAVRAEVAEEWRNSVGKGREGKKETKRDGLSRVLAGDEALVVPGKWKRWTTALVGAAAAFPRLHLLWSMLLDHILGPVATSAEEGKVKELQDNKNNKHSNNNKEKEDEEEGEENKNKRDLMDDQAAAVLLSDLWSKVVERSFLSGTHQRRAVAFRLLQRLAERLRHCPELLPAVLTPVVVDRLASNLSSTENYLYPIAAETLDVLRAAAHHSDAMKVAVVMCLLRCRDVSKKAEKRQKGQNEHKTGETQENAGQEGKRHSAAPGAAAQVFDRRSGTNTVAELISTMGREGIEAYARCLLQIIEQSEVEVEMEKGIQKMGQDGDSDESEAEEAEAEEEDDDDDDDDDVKMDDAGSTAEEQDGDLESARKKAEVRKIMAVDALTSLAKNFRAVGGRQSIKDILGYLMTAAFFDPASVNATYAPIKTVLGSSALSLSETQSPRVVEALQQRFFSFLGEISSADSEAGEKDAAKNVERSTDNPQHKDTNKGRDTIKECQSRSTTAAGSVGTRGVDEKEHWIVEALRLWVELTSSGCVLRAPLEEEEEEAKCTVLSVVDAIRRKAGKMPLTETTVAESTGKNQDKNKDKKKKDKKKSKIDKKEAQPQEATSSSVRRESAWECGLALLLSHVGLSLLDPRQREEAVGLVTDLAACVENQETAAPTQSMHEQIQKKKRGKEKGRAEEDEQAEQEQQSHSSVVLVEVLLAMLSQPSHLTREVVRTAFRVLCPEIDVSAMQEVVRVVCNGQNVDADDEEEDEEMDEEEEEEEEDEDDDDDDDDNGKESEETNAMDAEDATEGESDDDEDDNTHKGDGKNEDEEDDEEEEIRVSGEGDLLSALGQVTAGESAAEQAALAAMLAQRESAKRSRRQLQTEAVHFQTRAADLLDVFFARRKQEAALLPLVLALLDKLSHPAGPPVDVQRYMALLKDGGDDGEMQVDEQNNNNNNNNNNDKKGRGGGREQGALLQRLRSLLSSRLCKGKEAPAVRSAGEVRAALELTGKCVSMLRAPPSKADAELATQLFFLVVRALRAAGHLRDVVPEAEAETQAPAEAQQSKKRKKKKKKKKGPGGDSKDNNSKDAEAAWTAAERCVGHLLGEALRELFTVKKTRLRLPFFQQLAQRFPALAQGLLMHHLLRYTRSRNHGGARDGFGQCAALALAQGLLQHHLQQPAAQAPTSVLRRWRRPAREAWIAILADAVGEEGQASEQPSRKKAEALEKGALGGKEDGGSQIGEARPLAMKAARCRAVLLFGRTLKKMDQAVAQDKDEENLQSSNAEIGRLLKSIYKNSDSPPLKALSKELLAAFTGESIREEEAGKQLKSKPKGARGSDDSDSRPSKGKKRKQTEVSASDASATEGQQQRRRGAGASRNKRRRKSKARKRRDVAA